METDYSGVGLDRFYFIFKTHLHTPLANIYHHELWSFRCVNNNFIHGKILVHEFWESPSWKFSRKKLWVIVFIFWIRCSLSMVDLIRFLFMHVQGLTVYTCILGARPKSYRSSRVRQEVGVVCYTFSIHKKREIRYMCIFIFYDNNVINLSHSWYFSLYEKKSLYGIHV